ncbi:DHA2 family efflux MFS transporter permease subunit [Loigolactobacillus bifermentans]|jgi:DHA2 family lincomycin resistance protein-like MFS transporter|uniref:Lincomycin-resistance protein n=1 Tax=Loigolactobacillus bifermentans DSM 20003 TaxID=1423726 RepID=A0A0R1GN49_9LACO|nr:DHA2 family efflux MFS transporter permease subunit [Loigolactobacillus bifermentans]KRK33377.1 Lincomycin-resistance protein [Loigolactobacillus bifermentans DSM 20003]QGG60779.1 DHA2 family efflux MFS transporter permease subunit [Loigolactobacillus bifermentans]
MESTHALPTAKVKVTHPKLILLGLMLGSFVGMFSETALNIALPSFMQFFSISQSTVQWLVTGYMLVIGICMPLSSLLTRWVPTKSILLFALGGFMIGSLISASATHFTFVLIGRMIQGIGTGLILPLMFSIVMQIFPPHQLGTVMGLASLVIMLAPVLGPTVTGMVLSVASWRLIFWLFIPVLAVAFMLCAFVVENIFQQSHTPIDWYALLASTIGFSGIVVGSSLAASRGWLSMSVLGTLGIGLLALFIYAQRQLKATRPMLALQVFATRQFTIGTLLVMLDFGVILATMYLLPLYLRNGLKLPVALTGLVMLPGGAANAIVAALAGRIYDTHGAKWLTRGGFLLILLGVIVLLSTNTHTTLGRVILGHIIILTGAQCVSAPAQTYSLNSLDGAMSADGSAILNTLQQIVGALATAIATSLIAAQNQFIVGIHAGFCFIGLLAIIGFSLALKVQAPN